ncbi:YjcZ family sporulation protein [Ectobacillus panaciterrae]
MCMAPTYIAPAYGYGGYPSGGCGFALIVVLFILLIIIGASFCHHSG